MNSFANSESLAGTIMRGFGDAATLRTCRPGRLFQVEIPAFLPDGDGVQLYIEPGDGDRVRVTDIGQTTMRLSYTRDIDDAATAALARAAQRNGFMLEGGTLSAEVLEKELIPALFGLAQIQAVAEATIRPAKHRGQRAEEFREIVLSVLREVFAGNLEERVPLPASPELYEVDAILHGDRPIAIFAVPSDLEAERAIACRFRGQELQVRNWLAVPRDIEALSAKSRDRLIDAFTIANSRFDGRLVTRRLQEMVA
jgi:hypothetical protein